MTVTIYSKPDCVQCNATYQMLTRKNIPFSVIDITQDEQAYQHVPTNLPPSEPHTPEAP